MASDKKNERTFAAIVRRSKVDGSSSLVIQNKKLLQHRLAKLKDGDVVSFEIKIKTARSLRTDQQNRALHLYFELLANALNDGGLTIQKTLAQKMELDWDPTSVKELLWRPAQKVILRKESTRDLSKQEDIDKVYSHLARHLGEKFGIALEFPSAEPGYADTAPLKEDHEKRYGKNRS